MFSSFPWITNESGNEGTLKAHDVGHVFSKLSKSKDSNVNLISIFGRARQGKSFLMNCLAGEKEIFKISNEKDSCTQGIEISNKWLTLSEFSQLGEGVKVEGSMKIGFVDAEGQGDKDVSYDANLICPILLASKCVIFNWKGDLQKDHILTTLGIMTRAAGNVAADAVVHAKGSKAAPAAKKFGHLHIVFRDWQAVGSDEKSTEAAIFDLENTSSSSTRDQIRRDLRSTFESIRVWLFDAPTETVAELKSKLTYERTNKRFKEQVRSLRHSLAMQLTTPTHFGGSALTAKSFGPIVDQIVHSLNRGEVILPSSTFISMLKLELDHLRQKFEADYHTCIDRVLEAIDKIAAAKPLEAYLSEAEALEHLAKEAQQLEAYYEELKQTIVGTLSKEVADKVLMEYPKQLEAIRSNYRSQFTALYRNRFSAWLLSARQRAEAMLEKELQDIRSKLPLSEEDLDSALNDLLKAAIKMVGGEKSPHSEIVKDAIALLERFFGILTASVINMNQQLLEQDKGRIADVLVDCTNKMKAAVSDTATELKSANPNGYSISLLESALNAKYFELVKVLQSQPSRPQLIEAVADEFKQECAFLQAAMTKEYESARKFSMQAALDAVALDLSSYIGSLSKDTHVNLESASAKFSAIRDNATNAVLGWRETKRASSVSVFKEWESLVDKLMNESFEPLKIAISSLEEFERALQEMTRRQDVTVAAVNKAREDKYDQVMRLLIAQCRGDVSAFKQFLLQQLNDRSIRYEDIARQQELAERERQFQEQKERRNRELAAEKERAEREREKEKKEREARYKAEDALLLKKFAEERDREERKLQQEREEKERQWREEMLQLEKKAAEERLRLESLALQERREREIERERLEQEAHVKRLLLEKQQKEAEEAAKKLAASMKIDRDDVDVNHDHDTSGMTAEEATREARRLEQERIEQSIKRVKAALPKIRFGPHHVIIRYIMR